MRRIETENGFVEKRGNDSFFRAGQSGQWKDENVDFEKLEHKFSKTMRQFDYIPRMRMFSIRCGLHQQTFRIK